MTNKMNELETKLDELFVRNAPKLPKGGKKALVAWMPIISLVVGLISLVSAWGLWHWAHAADSVVNGLCNAYSVSGCGNIVVSRFSVWLWLGVIFVATEGVLYLLAYPGLRDHKKEGWDYLYYGALLNIVYAVVSLFTDYDKIGHFLGALIGSAVGFYLLFQIRALYVAKKRVAATSTKDIPSKG
jgi:hypothetical protein